MPAFRSANSTSSGERSARHVLADDGDDDEDESQKSQRIERYVLFHPSTVNAGKGLIDREQAEGGAEGEKQRIIGAPPEAQEEQRGDDIGHRHRAGDERQDGAHRSVSQMKPYNSTSIPARAEIRRGICRS